MKSLRVTDRAFGFTFAVVFAVIATATWWFTGVAAKWAVTLAIVFAALAAITPGLLMPLNRIWMWFAPKIGTLNNTVILGVVFYLFVTPVAFLMRLMRRDSMLRRLDPAAKTYWADVKRQTTAESFRDLF